MGFPKAAAARGLVMGAVVVGGVSPQNAPDWWAAGATVVGAGSNLVGDDFNHAPGTPAHAKAAAAWADGGREAAREVFRKAAERRASLSR